MPDPKIVVIGAGAAGLGVTIWLRRFGFDPIVLEKGHATGGQLLWLGNTIFDYPGIAASTGPALAAQFSEHAEALRAKILRDVTVHTLCPNTRTLETSKGTFKYSSLIIATGCRPRKLHVPGEEEMIQRGDVYIVARDKEQFRGRTVAIIGGGDRAVEGALLLAEVGARVILIHRSELFRARKCFLNRAQSDKNIRIITGAVVTEILGRYGVSGVVILRNGSISTIPCCAVIVRIGVIGNTQFITASVATSKEGFIKIDNRCNSSADNVWAIGDVASPSPILSVSTAVGHAALVAKQISLVENESSYFESSEIHSPHAYPNSVSL